MEHDENEVPVLESSWRYNAVHLLPALCNADFTGVEFASVSSSCPELSFGKASPQQHQVSCCCCRTQKWACDVPAIRQDVLS
jgi:hypothetical protein